jgi:sortase A
LYAPCPHPARRAFSDRDPPAVRYIGWVILRWVGRSFIAAGITILVFLAYQLFGTNVITQRDQNRLRANFNAEASDSGGATNLGDGIAIIRIPKIEVDRIVVEGVGVEDLKKGPGHYPGTSLPGQNGNVVISGHRTTYGAPFYRLDELAIGDEIQLVDLTTTYRYKVIETRIVKPTDLTVVVPSTDSRLTLTTCNPRFSARQRLIVVASLVEQPAEEAA